MNWKDVAARADALGLTNIPLNELSGAGKHLTILDFYNASRFAFGALTLMSTAHRQLIIDNKQGALKALEEADNYTKKFKEEIDELAIKVMSDALEAKAEEMGK